MAIALGEGMGDWLVRIGGLPEFKNKKIITHFAIETRNIIQLDLKRFVFLWIYIIYERERNRIKVDALLNQRFMLCTVLYFTVL